MAEKKEDVYLGVWFQRTSLHLKEVYEFFKYKKGVKGLNEQILKENLSKLNAKNPVYHEEADFEFVDATSNSISFSMTEDGIILLKTQLSDELIKNLEAYYSHILGPSLNYLFSRGAPVPKDLTIIKEAYPLYFAVNNFKEEQCLDFFRRYNDLLYSVVKNNYVEIYLGKRVAVFNFLRLRLKSEEVDELVRHIVLFREFERQLNHYIELHRSIWDKISDIRESGHLSYKDFPSIRENIFNYLKTLSFVRARLAQMHDILHARAISAKESIKKQLEAFQLFDRFEMLESSHHYVEHLWDMTIEYAKGTLSLLESLYAENTQRELNALRFITLLGVLVGFFGMNIAFPWEDRWKIIFQSSLAVIAVILAASIIVYWLLKMFIVKRQFKLRKA